ncbi:MAG: VWA domain-containing protein [Myxococcota bacterium]|nr:VWA domain-containing protein [Myxococcota bacterium]
MSRIHPSLPLLMLLAAGCTQREPAMETMDYELTEADDGERYDDDGRADKDANAPQPAPEAVAEAEPMEEVSVDEVQQLSALGYTEGVAAPASTSRRAPPRAQRKAEAPMAVGGALADASIAPPPAGRPAPVTTTGTTTATPEPQSNTEAYAHYGVNDMTLVDKDRFSTFSVDVDTASYAISRRKLNEGMLPPTSAVRVEEFVNAFHYDYAAPSYGSNDGAPFAIHMEAAPSPFDSSHHILRVGVKGMEIPQDDREPMHLTFLVDTSGSMSSADKLGLAKNSLHTLVENLQPHDTVALVTYAGSTQILLQPTQVSQQRAIHAAIDGLSSGGGTHMSTGMELAYQVASETAVQGHENRVVVLSDGDANIGRTSHEEILRVVGQYAEEGITLSTIGFGMGNYKDVMMEQLANKGDGNYAYIDSQAEANKVFGEDLAGTTLTIAKDVKLQVEFNPQAVIAYRLIGYENRDIADRDFRNDRVDAGEIGAGHNVTALYEVVLRDDAASQELATVRVRAKKPGPDSPAREWATVFDGDLLHSEFDSASKDFRLAFAAATFAELLRGSPYVVEVSYQDVAAIANRASRGKEEDSELLKLISTAAQLSGERSPMVRL